jgi:GxxExxY protein
MVNGKPIQKTEISSELNNLSYRVIGAAIEVHNTIGPGYLEDVYEEALCVELKLRDIPFRRQVRLPVRYKNVVVGEGRLDILVAEQLIVELKAVEALAKIHMAQLYSYLRAIDSPLGLLINFNVLELREGGIKRVILSNNANKPSVSLR